MGRLIGRRVGKFFKIVLVGPIPNIHFRLESLAVTASLPISAVFLNMMKAAERVAAVISVATVRGVREHHVFVLIIAYLIPAAFGLRKIPSLAAETAPGSKHRCPPCALLCFDHHYAPSVKCYQAQRQQTVSRLSRAFGQASSLGFYRHRLALALALPIPDAQSRFRLAATATR